MKKAPTPKAKGAEAVFLLIIQRGIFLSVRLQLFKLVLNLFKGEEIPLSCRSSGVFPVIGAENVSGGIVLVDPDVTFLSLQRIQLRYHPEACAMPSDTGKKDGTIQIAWLDGNRIVLEIR